MTDPRGKLNAPRRRFIAIRALIIIIPSALILAYLISAYHELELKEDRFQIANREFNHLRVLELSIIKDLSDVTSDLEYLHSTLEFGIKSNAFELTSIPFTLKHNFLTFSQSKGLYDQIRVLNTDGQEQIRINYNQGSAVIVPDAQLQNKSNRYYFKESMALEEDEIFISPFDLNIEQGVIETPVKPMIRFGMPFSDKNQETSGVVLLNYLGDELLQNFSDNDDDCSGQCMLLNTDGYYLFHPDSSERWGFMYPGNEDKTLAAHFPDVWDSVCIGEGGQYMSEAGLVTYRSFYPLAGSGNTSMKWILATHLPQNTYAQLVHHDEDQHMVTFILLMIMMTTIAILVGVVSEKRYQIRQQVLDSEQTHRELSVELRESNRFKELLLDVITHDLKNPAGVIHSMSEMLFDELPDNEMVKLINLSSTSLQKVMEHSTTLSKISAGENIDLEPLNLTTLVTQVLEDLSSQFESHEIEIESNLPEELIALANPIIREIFQNYLTNVLRYASESECVRIQGKIENGSILLEFIDEGTTIPESSRSLVFRRGLQLEAEKKRGSGLGLAIVKRIAAMHHAEVGVSPNHPQGNNFWLRIPST